MKKTATLLCLIFLSGCTLFTPEQRDSISHETPAQFTLYSEDPASPSSPDRWWISFNSDELNLLITEALANNFDIQTAWARLNQTAATLRITGAFQSPTLDLTTDIDRESSKTDSSNSKSDTTTYGLGAAASYEVDLWGRLSALKSAQESEFMASRQDLETIAITTAASVTELWVNLLSVQQQIDVLNEQIEVNQTLLEVQYLRFSNGQTKALDVSQQKERLASTRLEMPGLAREYQELKNSLALILGRTSAQSLEITTKQLPQLIPLPEPGLPADLLASRPDVKAAGLRLTAADWTISAAKADRLPSLNISAQGSYGATSIDQLTNNWITNLTASLVGPIFDGGMRKAEVDRTLAIADERLSEYRKTVATAIIEVENALLREARQQEYIDLLGDQLRAAKISTKDAGLQYSNGQSDFLSFLLARTTVQNIELQAIREQASQINYRINLYRALGADWPQGLAVKTETTSLQP